MIYPIVIHKEKGSDYGVTVPDLPGCFSAGSTVDEAMAMAREAIELHMEGLIAEGEAVPAPRAVDVYQRRREYRGGTWAVVEVDGSKLRKRAKRVNVTIPERVLAAVDRAAKGEGETRSGLLVKAVGAYLAGKRGKGKWRKGA